MLHWLSRSVAICRKMQRLHVVRGAAELGGPRVHLAQAGGIPSLGPPVRAQCQPGVVEEPVQNQPVMDKRSDVLIQSQVPSGAPERPSPARIRAQTRPAPRPLMFGFPGSQVPTPEGSQVPYAKTERIRCPRSGDSYRGLYPSSSESPSCCQVAGILRVERAWRLDARRSATPVEVK